jgi:hypothetical protein
MKLDVALVAVMLTACGLGTGADSPGESRTHQAVEWHNRQAGDGWRLVADGLVEDYSQAYLVHAATDEEAYRSMWEGLGMGEPAPSVDLGDEIVVSFALGIGSTCPEVRLDDVRITDDEVFSVTSDPIVDGFGSARVCTDDLVGAVVFVVAVAREALPADGFTLLLSDGSRTYSDPVDVQLSDR